MICSVVLLTVMVSGIVDGQRYVYEYTAGRGPGICPAYWGNEYDEVIAEAERVREWFWDPTYLACEEVYGPGIVFNGLTPCEEEAPYLLIQYLLDQLRYEKPWMVPEFMCNSVAACAWYVMVTDLGIDAYIAHNHYHNHVWVMAKWTEDPDTWIAIEPCGSMGTTLGTVVMPRSDRDFYYSAGTLYNTSSELWAMGQKLNERYVSTRTYPDIPVVKNS